MTQTKLIAIVAAIALVYGVASNEYKKLIVEVSATQNRINNLADESIKAVEAINRSIADIRKSFSETDAKLSAVTELANSAVAYQTSIATEIERLRSVEPAQTQAQPKQTRRLVMHSGDGCGPCNDWKVKHKPVWESNGWTVEVVTELYSQKPWPWFEIFDGEKPKRIIEGSLPYETYAKSRK